MPHERHWLDEVVLRSALSCEADVEAPPPWSRRLHRALADAVRPSIEDDGRRDLPFFSVWSELVGHAEAVLGEHEPSDSLFHTALVAGMRRWLRSELSALGLPVLMHEFTRFRNGTAIEPQRGRSTAAYDAFTDRLREGGLIELFVRYPVWARLVGSRLEHTIQATRRLEHHWTRDRSALTQRGTTGSPSVREIELGLSEPHHGGRTVARISFADEQNLYYKPRAPAGHSILRGVLDHLTEALGEPRPNDERMLGFEDHAWAVGVPHQPAESTAEGLAFHRHAGMVLFGLYLTGSVDAHADNVVACGATMEVIDAECLMHPRLRDERVAEAPEDSVLDTGLLPRWARDPRGRWYSQAGLSDPRPFEPRRAGWAVDASNTDRMRCRRSWTQGNSGANVVWVREGLGVSERERARAVENGFRRSYRAFLANATTMSAELLERAAEHRGRCVVRPTSHYTSLTERLLRPTALTDGAAAEHTLTPLRETLSPIARSIHATALDRLVAAEMQDLVAGDVPAFYCDAGRDVLLLADGSPIEGLLARSALDDLRSRLARLGHADLDHQCRLIRSAFEPPPPSNP